MTKFKSLSELKAAIDQLEEIPDDDSRLDRILASLVDILHCLAEKIRPPAQSSGGSSGPDYPDKVKEIAEVASDVLSEWECNFIESMGTKTYFSDKMKAVIDKCYKKACESGE